MNFIKKIASITTALLMVSAMPCGAPFASAEQSAEGLYINEVCSQNKSCFTDSLGRASDWIELYNDSTADIDLSGFGLTDDESAPMKYIFPSGSVIKHGEYLIIAAAKNGADMTDLNTGFSLSKSGETLILSSPDGAELIKLEIPALAEDTTYGRLSDGSFSVMSPTPASANQSVTIEPVFSLESGFYSENDVKELTINSKDTIFYTLDGSDPTTSDTVEIYSGAIPMYDRSSEDNVYSKFQHEDNSPYSINLAQYYVANPEKFDKATIVRAAALSEDGTFSRVVSKTYFIMNDEKLSYYSDIPVISVVTDPDNLFGKDKGIYVAGQKYMDWLEKIEAEPNASYSLDEVANFYSSGKKWEREADITYFEDGKLGFDQKMGIRIRGSATRNSSAKSFNLYARSEYGDSKLDYKLIDDNYSVDDGKIIKRYDSFGLRAVTWVDRLREHVVDSSVRDLPALSTYACDRCMLFIDGELWGMYEITEKASDYYIQSKYGVPSENVTIIKNGELEEGPDEEPMNLQLLGEFCRDNDLTVPENYEYVTSKVDIDSIIDCYCTGLYICTWDWPNYNYFLWRYNGDEPTDNPYTDGKWRFGAFDFDYSVGLSYADADDSELYKYDSFKKVEAVKEGIPTLIFSELLKNPEFKQKFADRFYSFAYSVFESSKMCAELDAEESRYMDYYAMSAWRWYDGNPAVDFDSFIAEQKEYYHSEMEVMRTFFKNRAEYAVENMQNYLGISKDSSTVTVTVQGNGDFSVDSADAAFSGNVWTGTFEKGQELTLTAKPADNYTFAGWTGAVNSDSPTITVTADKAVSLVCNFKLTEYRQGDLNMDGTVNVADLLLMNKYLLGTESITKKQFKLADMNEDSSADIFDMVCLRRELVQ